MSITPSKTEEGPREDFTVYDPNELIPPYDILKRLDPLFVPPAKAYKINHVSITKTSEKS